MHKYFSKKRSLPEEGGSGTSLGVGNETRNDFVPIVSTPMASACRELVDLEKLPSDPALRKMINEYHPNQVDDIRRHYLLKGPYQPRTHNFPKTMIGKSYRRFIPNWFDQYPKWLEYSKLHDKAYCLCCYLFRDTINHQGKGVFITEGFSSWHKSERLAVHCGDVNSSHYISAKKCEDLMRKDQSVSVALHRQNESERMDNRIQLCASIGVCRIILHQGLAFRGHNESESSLNRGNFIEFLKYAATLSEAINRVVLGNSRALNRKMICGDIQKQIVHCFQQEVVRKILEEFKDDYFSLLVDESSDVSGKEQMAVVLRYVDSLGNLKERFICVVHVMETTALSLKSAVDTVFSNLNLSLAKVRGQGYDGASNMRGEFNGLKSLIMRENSSAHYIHCFAHQLQLALIAVARKNDYISNFFNLIATLTTVVGASCKRKDQLRESQAKKLKEGIEIGSIETGTGLNQELGLARAGDTRWGSHYRSLLHVSGLFSSVLDVLEYVSADATDYTKSGYAAGLMTSVHRFDFVFNLQMMLTILSLTNQLSLALQRKDIDILNAMHLVKVTKQRLQETRNDGWDLLLETVLTFCKDHKIPCLDMNDVYVDIYHPRRKTNVTNEFHFRVECFYAILDQQLFELNERFNEVNSELLICVGSLSPKNGFSDFDVSKLKQLAHFYPDDFTLVEMMSLHSQLETYIVDVRMDDRFGRLEGLTDLCTTMVKTSKHLSYPLLFRLLKFALLLPIATASVERAFSAMNLIKTDIRSRICDQFLNDCLVCFIEKDLFKTITDDDVIEPFQRMTNRRGQI